MTETQVECYSGSRYGERPTAFTWQGTFLRVESILRSWQEPDARCFLVKTAGDLVFELCYQESADQWQAELSTPAS